MPKGSDISKNSAGSTDKRLFTNKSLCQKDLAKELQAAIRTHLDSPGAPSSFCGFVLRQAWGIYSAWGLFLMWAVVEIISCFEAVNLLLNAKPVIDEASEITLALAPVSGFPVDIEVIEKGNRK